MDDSVLEDDGRQVKLWTSFLLAELILALMEVSWFFLFPSFCVLLTETVAEVEGG